MLSFAIIEDEDDAAETLESHIKRFCLNKKLLFNIKRFNSAMNFLSEYKPIYDIVFMDIVLPNMNGLEAAKELRKLDETVILIFVTSMSNMAVKGYEVSALDFIVKPVEYDAFAPKLQRACRNIAQNKNVDVTIQVGRSIKIIPASSIYYIEVLHHSLVFHTDMGNIQSRGTLDYYEKQLAAENFVRCNACYLST